MKDKMFPRIWFASIGFGYCPLNHQEIAVGAFTRTIDSGCEFCTMSHSIEATELRLIRAHSKLSARTNVRRFGKKSPSATCLSSERPISEACTLPKLGLVLHLGRKLPDVSGRIWPIPADTTGGSRLVPAYYYRQSSVPKLPVATGRA